MGAERILQKLKDLKYNIWLSNLNISPEKIKTCIKENKNQKIWDLQEEKLKLFFTTKEVEKIYNSKDKEKLQIYEEYIMKYGINMLAITDDNYPIKLKQIEDSPIILYTLGNLELLKEKNIAIVGSRKCSEYGKNVAEAFSYLLSKENIIITSGLAEGIDTFAHKGSLLANGKTIAVIGTGIDKVYPKENKQLLMDIIKNEGLIISEFPIGTIPNKINFPKRNRIISALSDGVLVIEAGEKSGALITVEYALEQGKNIYAVPRKHFIYYIKRNK